MRAVITADLAVWLSSVLRYVLPRLGGLPCSEPAQMPQTTVPTSLIRENVLAKSFAVVFVTVFLAEVGDKTQLATMLFAAEKESSKWLVFLASSAALVAAAAIGVLVGSQLERVISPAALKIVAGVGFILVGAWTLLSR